MKGGLFGSVVKLGTGLFTDVVGEVANLAGGAANQATANYNAAANPTTMEPETPVAAPLPPPPPPPPPPPVVVTQVSTQAVILSVVTVQAPPPQAAPSTVTVPAPSIVTVSASESEETQGSVHPEKTHVPNATSIVDSSVEHTSAIMHSTADEPQPSSSHRSRNDREHISTIRHSTTDEPQPSSSHRSRNRRQGHHKFAMLKPRLATPTIMAFSTIASISTSQSLARTIDATPVSSVIPTPSPDDYPERRWQYKSPLITASLAESTLDALQAMAAPQTYSTCVFGQACYGMDGTLTTSVSVAVAPTLGLDDGETPSTSANNLAYGSSSPMTYGAPLLPTSTKHGTLIRRPTDGMAPYPTRDAGIDAYGTGPTGFVGAASTGFLGTSPIGPVDPGIERLAGGYPTAPSGTYPASVANSNDSLGVSTAAFRKRWEDSRRRLARDVSPTSTEITPAVETAAAIPASSVIPDASPWVSSSDAISNPATAGATTMLDPNAKSTADMNGISRRHILDNPPSTLVNIIRSLNIAKRAAIPTKKTLTGPGEPSKSANMATPPSPNTGKSTSLATKADVNASPTTESKVPVSRKGSRMSREERQKVLESLKDVIFDPNDDKMWAELTVGVCRFKDSSKKPKGAGGNTNQKSPAGTKEPGAASVTPGPSSRSTKPAASSQQSTKRLSKRARSKPTSTQPALVSASAKPKATGSQIKGSESPQTPSACPLSRIKITPVEDDDSGTDTKATPAKKPKPSLKDSTPSEKGSARSSPTTSGSSRTFSQPPTQTSAVNSKRHGPAESQSRHPEPSERGTAGKKGEPSDPADSQVPSSFTMRSPGHSPSKQDKNNPPPDGCRDGKKSQKCRDRPEGQQEPLVPPRKPEVSETAQREHQNPKPNPAAPPSDAGSEEEAPQPPYTLPKRPPPPPYPPKNSIPKDYGLDKWSDLTAEEGKKLMKQIQAWEAHTEDSDKPFCPPLRPASAASTVPGTNRWTGQPIGEDGQQYTAKPDDMSEEVPADITQSEISPHEQNMTVRSLAQDTGRSDVLTGFEGDA